MVIPNVKKSNVRLSGLQLFLWSHLMDLNGTI